ncbi:uncharacterized protein LOC126657788 isoform X2 [Mercurialis annua]|uniref:uncharacterized protein LOC126657788 isoform X2 n=1 Tax=Mercurialis annua TaxID=3986 RepID=UPI00215F802D|nr:uncharacterized protein LOC126657788 isoform X2 [Mercurialis annua]
MSDKSSTKGTVTSLASIFPVDEAQKAAKRVEEAISDKQNELKNINQFVSDNTNLINLISSLPDELHHDVMVPFGKAAFFPGKLIHTNELMVLLGEGYYAERTAKQTVEILKRRAKVLDSQVESLKANIKDLRAEASFFDSTASEAAEGLVEIREDYVEESCSEGQSISEAGENKAGVEDNEYAHIMSRLDELEKEELEAEGRDESEEDENTDSIESDYESDENEQTDTAEIDNESDKDDDEQTDTAKRDRYIHEYTENKANSNSFSSQAHSAEVRKSQKQPTLANASIEALSDKYLHQLDIADQPNCTGLMVQPQHRDDMTNSKHSTHLKKSLPAKAMQLPTVKEETETVSSSKHEAFTGSIVERTRNLPTSPDQTTTSSQSSNLQPTKPVSRFKMQRR